MPTTTNKGYSTPTYNSQVGLWGTTDLNGNFTIQDNNLGGVTTVSLSSTNVTLSSSQAQNLSIFLTGTLSTNVTVSTPCIGFFWVINNTTGAYTVTLQANFGGGAVGSSFIIPQGSNRLFVSDATNGLRYGAAPSSIYLPGEIKAYAGSSAPTGWLLCYGQEISRATYASLFSVIGTTYGAGNGSTTFLVPDLRGRGIAGLDNMGGSDAGRLDWSNTLGTVGGEQTHTLTTTEMPSHTHTDTGHAHDVSLGVNGTPYGLKSYGDGYTGNCAIGGVTTTTATAYASLSTAGSGAAHNVMQPTILLNYIICAF